MMLHRHFEAMREAENTAPAASKENGRMIPPANNVKEGADIVPTATEKKSRRTKEK